MVTEANIPSARRGIKLLDTVKAAGFDTLNEFQEFLAARGKPMIGTKGGEESLELLNSMVGKKDQYVKMYPEYVEMEEKTLKTSNPKIKKQEGQKIANKLIEIADDANILYGEKTSTKKTSFIKDAVKKAGILIDDAAKLGLKAMLPMAGPLGGALAVALSVATIPSVADATLTGREPSLEDQIRARIKQEGFDQKGPSLLDQMQADPQNIGMARGGVASIFNMTRPLGYKNAGEVGIKEAILKALENRNLVDKGFFISPDDIYKDKGMSDEEIKRQKEINKIMTDRFTKDPYEGMSDEKKQELKRIRRIQRLIREKQREEMGLPDFIQLLGSN